MEKACTKCGETKPLDAFAPDKRRKSGRQSWCRECQNTYKRNSYAADPVAAQRSRDKCAARRRGEKLEPIGLARPADVLFDEKWIEDENGCHIWQAKIDKKGYGVLEVNGKMILAHRWNYARAYGPIPDGLELHHECRTKPCVRPEHLLAVTEEAHRKIHTDG